MKDRRELLKGLAVGSAWATPVVSSMVLPVHAETSGCSSQGITVLINARNVGENGDSWGGAVGFNLWDNLNNVLHTGQSYTITANSPANGNPFEFETVPGRIYYFRGGGGAGGGIRCRINGKPKR